MILAMEQVHSVLVVTEEVVCSSLHATIACIEIQHIHEEKLCVVEDETYKAWRMIYDKMYGRSWKRDVIVVLVQNSLVLYPYIAYQQRTLTKSVLLSHLELSAIPLVFSK